jgi:CHAT domain-containing protein
MGRQEPFVDNPVPQLNRVECHATEDLDQLVEAGETALFKAEFSLALLRYQCGLQVARARGDLPYTARYSYLVARARAFSGDYDGALEDAKQSLEIARRIQARLIEAEAVKVIAAVHQSKGEYARSLELLQEALRITIEAGDGLSEAKTRNALGQVYGLLGRHETALQNYKKALSGFRAAGDRRGQGIIFHNMGVAYRKLGDDTRALRAYDAALAIRKELDDLQLQQETLQNLGAIYISHGCYTAALRNYDYSLTVTKQIGHRLEEARTHHHLGLLYYQLGRFDEALLSFQSALAIASTFAAPELLWRVWHGLSSTQAQLSRPNTAIFFGKQAVNVLQGMRAGLTRLEPTVQSSFLEDKARVYKDLANLLIDEGRLAEAQQVLDSLKQKEYLDYIRSGIQADAKPSQLEFSATEERAGRSTSTLVALAAKWNALFQRGADRLTPEEKDWFDRAGTVLELAFNAIRVEVAALDEASRKSGGWFNPKEFDSLQSFQGTLESLGGGVVCVYFVAADKLRIFVTVGDTRVPPFVRESPVSERELNRLIIRYRQTLDDPATNPLPQARKLYDYLLKPIEDEIEAARAKILLVYLDGALRYLPLAALHDGRTYVAERYAVVIYTAAMKDRLLFRPAEGWHVAGMGVSEASPGFDALPAVEEELNAIVTEGSGDSTGVLPGVRYLNREFTKDRLSSVLHERKYQVVHLASHFHFSPGAAENSFLLLGGGEKLPIQELRSLKFPLTQVDLLTLSACETGVGTAAGATVHNGGEIESFGALAQEQGAKAVIATLWPVADRSTGRFMQLFYWLRQTNNLSKAEALRRAQAIFIHADATSLEGAPAQVRSTQGSAIEAGKRYSHPFYWAPFILMGNWQ